MQNWMSSIQENCPEGTQVVLIANKSDLAQEDREVTKEMGKELAEKFGVAFFEVSALDGSNVNEIFVQLSRTILEKHPKIAVYDTGKHLLQGKSNRPPSNSC